MKFVGSASCPANAVPTITGAIAEPKDYGRAPAIQISREVIC